ncbi:hypothetical protein DFH27DRAFT_580636 [Peziza echinospora]|nr:hypothetical protein DFH27DRAFT_580636 [Peziza echinospora]
MGDIAYYLGLYLFVLFFVISLSLSYIARFLGGVLCFFLIYTFFRCWEGFFFYFNDTHSLLISSLSLL